MDDNNVKQDALNKVERDLSKQKLIKHIAILNSTLLQAYTKPTSETYIFYNLASKRLTTDDQLKQLATIYNLSYASSLLRVLSSLCAVDKHNESVDGDSFYKLHEIEYMIRCITTNFYDLFMYSRNQFINDYNELGQCCLNFDATVDFEPLKSDTDIDKHYMSYLLLKLIYDIFKLIRNKNLPEIYDVYGELIGIREIFGEKSLRELIDIYGMFLTDESDFRDSTDTSPLADIDNNHSETNTELHNE